MVDVKRKHHHAPKVTAPPPPPPPATTDAARPAGDNAKPADVFATASVNNAPGAAPNAPPKIDISDDAKLKELQNGSPDDKKLASEIVNARKSYKPLLDAGAKITLTTSKGNGDKPVFTVVPKALQDNPHQQFNVDVHYSGKFGTAASPDPNAHAAEKMATQLNGPPPTVFVLPEPQNYNANPVRSGDGAFSPVWDNAMNPRVTADDALKAAGLDSTGGANKLTVSAHSAGGRAVANAINAGTLDCDRLELQDCLYGDKAPKGAPGKPDPRGTSCATAVEKWAGSQDGAKCQQIDYIHTKQGVNGEAGEFPDGKHLKGGQTVHRYEKPLHYDAAFFVTK